MKCSRTMDIAAREHLMGGALADTQASLGVDLFPRVDETGFTNLAH